MKYKKREFSFLKKSKLVFIILIIFPQISLATDITLGFNLGYREIKDPDLKEIYGDGYVYKPNLKYFPHEMWGLELSYEGGYKKEALVGSFQEESTLNVSGVQLCGVFRFRAGFLEPYFKFGVAAFSYKQDIQSQYVRRKVDHHQWTSVIGGGAQFKVSRMLFFIAELEYIPLIVKPFEKEVDLGRFRGLLGIGLNIPLKKLHHSE